MSEHVPDVMRVARVHAWGDVRIEQEPVPRPGPGEVLVRIEACGVCGSDALDWYVARKAPAVLGHEPAATVVLAGEGVNRVRVGDRVFVHHHAPCGICAQCRRRLWSNCAQWRSTRLIPGGFAEYARVMAASVTGDTLVLPADMTFETATFVEPVACCIRAVQGKGRVQAGDTVAIVGLGAMGLVMVQLAREAGAQRVIGSDFLQERRAHALQLAADEAVDPDVTPLVEAVGADGADVVLVCPGDARAIDAGLAAAAPGGRVVCFTPLPPDRPLSLDQSSLYFREVVLLQSYSCGPDETRAALALLAAGTIRVDSLITHRAGLDGVAAALQRAAGGGEGIKTIIYPGR